MDDINFIIDNYNIIFMLQVEFNCIISKCNECQWEFMH
jgi:hypothetical protein